MHRREWRVPARRLVPDPRAAPHRLAPQRDAARDRACRGVPRRLRDPLGALYGSKPFAGTGIWRTLYFTNLVPHVILAIAVGPLAFRLIRLALVKRDFAAHRRLARITLPIWLYVAASGWIVYYMLYRMQF